MPLCAVFPLFLDMSKKSTIPGGMRKHLLTNRMKALAAKALSLKIGRLNLGDFSNLPLPARLPTQSFNPNRIIRFKDELCLVRHGSVEIWHVHHDRLVTTLRTDALFGDMALLGQTMLDTQAISGPTGATISLLDIQAVKAWIEPDPFRVLEKVGTRLSYIESEHYRAEFQLADSRIAALLLEIAGKGSAVEGYSHEQIGERLGLYRETVTVILDGLKFDKLIEVGRKRIRILDKGALRELSEL
jgi:CRP-like cAMP-binding protein